MRTKEDQPPQVSTLEQLRMRLQEQYLLKKVTLSDGKEVMVVNNQNFQHGGDELIHKDGTCYLVSTRHLAIGFEIPSVNGTLGIRCVLVRPILVAGVSIAPGVQKDALVLVRLLDQQDGNPLAMRQIHGSNFEDYDLVDLQIFTMFDPLADHPELETINSLQVAGIVVGIKGEVPSQGSR